MFSGKPLIVRIISWLFSVILITTLIVGGIAYFIYARYQINIFDVIASLSALNKEVSEEEMIPNKYSDDDMKSVMTKVNTGVGSDVIIYDETTKSYSIASSTSIPKKIFTTISLNDKEVGALLNLLISTHSDTSASVGGSSINIKDYDLKLGQVKIDNIDSNITTINYVISISLNKVKEKMTSFPLNLLKGKVPSKLYLSSTIKITKGTTPFEYKVSSVNLSLNKVKQDTINDIFTLINKFVNIGSVDDVNLNIGTSLTNAIIGNSDNEGFAYALKDAGAVDFDFKNVDSVNYYMIKALI
jgi:hypothetical protein